MTPRHSINLREIDSARMFRTAVDSATLVAAVVGGVEGGGAKGSEVNHGEAGEGGVAPGGPISDMCYHYMNMIRLTFIPVVYISFAVHVASFFLVEIFFLLSFFPFCGYRHFMIQLASCICYRLVYNNCNMKNCRKP